MPFSQSGGGAGGSSSPSFEIGYAQITANTNITDTAEATGTALITAGPFTFDGGPVMFQFFTPSVLTDTNAAADTVTITLWDITGAAAEIGIIGQVRSDVTTTNNTVAVSCSYRFTPTAGSHTYKLCAFVPSTAGTPRIGAGTAAGAGTLTPAFVRFTKV